MRYQKHSFTLFNQSKEAPKQTDQKKRLVDVSDMGHIPGSSVSTNKGQDPIFMSELAALV